MANSDEYYVYKITSDRNFDVYVEREEDHPEFIKIMEAFKDGSPDREVRIPHESLGTLISILMDLKNIP